MNKRNVAALALLAGLSACVTGRSADDVLAPWVGQDARYLKANVDLIWWDSTDDAKNEYLLYADFGTNAHVRDDSYDRLAAVIPGGGAGGVGQPIYDRVEQKTYVPKQTDCVIRFFADATTYIIQRYESEGRCGPYLSWFNNPPRSGVLSDGTVVKRIGNQPS